MQQQGLEQKELKKNKVKIKTSQERKKCKFFTGMARCATEDGGYEGKRGMRGSRLKMLFTLDFWNVGPLAN
jgi:hypothetical protein